MQMRIDDAHRPGFFERIGKPGGLLALVGRRKVQRADELLCHALALRPFLCAPRVGKRKIKADQLALINFPVSALIKILCTRAEPSARSANHVIRTFETIVVQKKQ